MMREKIVGVVPVLEHPVGGSDSASTASASTANGSQG